VQGRYILFTSPDCIFCKKALDLLMERSEHYKVVEFQEGQQEVLNDIKQAYTWKTVPMIFYRLKNTIQFIGGYTDLVEYFEQEESK
jgi:glutaredoxin